MSGMKNGKERKDKRSREIAGLTVEDCAIDVIHGVVLDNDSEIYD